MSLPLFVAVPGDAVIVRAKKRNYPGIVKFVSGGGWSGHQAETRYIVTIYGHDLEVDGSQIENAL